MAAKSQARALVMTLLVISLERTACFVLAGPGGALTRALLRPTGTAARSSSTHAAWRAQADNILVLDHFNLNHLKGQHDVLKAFYSETLGCAIDPRKEENVEKGRKTLWMNLGINQLHLPEADEAQVLDGRFVIAYPDLDAAVERLTRAPALLASTMFAWERLDDNRVSVTCPWGNTFELIAGARDPRGVQPGADSTPAAMPEVLVHVPHASNMEGIARFYAKLVGASVSLEDGTVRVRCGLYQTLVFAEQPSGVQVEHSDYHVSMYVEDFPGIFQRMEALGLMFVNPRFSRQARTLEEAVDQCMFRILDIVDPDRPEAGPIVQLEHEIRSPRKADGSKYKSCPLEIPQKA